MARPSAVTITGPVGETGIATVSEPTTTFPGFITMVSPSMVKVEV